MRNDQLGVFVQFPGQNRFLGIAAGQQADWSPPFICGPRNLEHIDQVPRVLEDPTWSDQRLAQGTGADRRRGQIVSNRIVGGQAVAGPVGVLTERKEGRDYKNANILSSFTIYSATNSCLPGGEYHVTVL